MTLENKTNEEDAIALYAALAWGGTMLIEAQRFADLAESYLGSIDPFDGSAGGLAGRGIGQGYLKAAQRLKNVIAQTLLDPDAPYEDVTIEDLWPQPKPQPKAKAKANGRSRTPPGVAVGGE